MAATQPGLPSMKMPLSTRFEVLAWSGPASEADVQCFRAQFGAMPAEYACLVADVCELELSLDGTQYVRIWGPAGCVDMNAGHEFTRYIPACIPIGDDGGGRTFMYTEGKAGKGIYLVSNGNIDMADSQFISGSLHAMLLHAEGLERL